MKSSYVNRRYHSFFEGYTEKEVTVNGKTKIDRVYTGDYYKMKLSEKSRFLRKLSYSAAYCSAVCSYIFTALQDISLNYNRLIGICHGLLLIMLLWIAVSLFDYLSGSEMMKARAYKNGCRRMIILVKTGMVISVVMTLGYVGIAIVGQQAAFELFHVLPGALACTISLAIIFFTEKNTEYEIVANENAALKDGKVTRC